MTHLVKYPRTQHLEGSRSQPGDEDLDAVPFAEICGRPVVAEEKLDGGNAGLSFDDAGNLLLQSRGHFLTGGAREKQFAPFKQWAACHAGPLRERLGSRFVVFGEWAYAKHTIFYDLLPHYFHEFDVYDRREDSFLSTDRRRELLAKLPLVSVPVLWSGCPKRLEELTSLVSRSLYKSDHWRDNLSRAAEEHGIDPYQVARETDPSDLAEGLYLKVEEGGRVVARLKWVRASFLTSVLDSGSHWMRRPVLPNRLAVGVDLFGAAP